MYQMTLPAAMRVFKATSKGSKLVYNSGRCLEHGQKVRIVGVVVMSYDHRDKLALKLEMLSPDECYLLIEEMGEDVAALAFEWTALYEKSVLGETTAVQEDAKSKMNELTESLTPLLRRHIRPELRAIKVGEQQAVAFEPQGPGVRFLPLLS